VSNDNVDGPESPAERPASRDSRLAQRFVSLADTLVDDYDLVELLSNLVDTCVELLDVSAAGLLLLDGSGRLQPVASSAETTHLLELFQLQNDEGPCLDCVRTGRPVAAPDLAAMRKVWPRFSVAAAKSGYQSVHALPMRLRRETIGSLNLFHEHPPPMAVQEQLIAQALADVATIGILQQRSLQRASELAEQLQQALNTRIVVEQAKGVLAEFGGLGMDKAFEALRRFSRQHNLKLAAVADGLVNGRTAPSDVVGRRAD
jgi:GAF domain-containing protein